jgi:hypothetical protein
MALQTGLKPLHRASCCQKYRSYREQEVALFLAAEQRLLLRALGLIKVDAPRLKVIGGWGCRISKTGHLPLS